MINNVLKSTLSAGKLIGKIPLIKKIKDNDRYQRLRHWIALYTDPRINSTFTGFLRLPTQFKALTGPVMDLVCDGQTDEKLAIFVVGCSNGAEAYTIASLLKADKPDLEFQIYAFDIDEEMLSKARAAQYRPAEDIYNNKIITEDFIKSTFDQTGTLFKVKDTIARHVSFQYGNALDTDLVNKIGQADIIFVQNFLFHMAPKTAQKALQNICGLLKDTAAIFVDGTDLNLRNKVTRRISLSPLEYKLEQIHNEARRARAVGYPEQYWGLEPFDSNRKDYIRRYATIFYRTTKSEQAPE